MSMSDDDTGHWRTRLLLDTTDPEFTRGFEAGTLWTLVRDPDYDSIDAVCSAANAEMLIRMGEATGRSFRAEPVDGTGEWMRVLYGPLADAEAEA